MVAATFRQVMGGVAECAGQLVGQGCFYMADLLAPPTANPRRVRVPRRGLLVVGDSLLVTPSPDGLQIKPLKMISGGKEPEGVAVPDTGTIH